MKKILIIVQLLFLCVFLACAGYLAKYFYDSHKAQSDIAELQQIVEETDDGAQEDTYKPIARASNGMLQKYYDLYRQNEDIVGWISIPGTRVDYPVMYKADNNDYYLHRNFKKEYQYSGLPFLDYQCNLAEPSANLIIYAHNMKDGTMFAPLTEYESKTYYEDHKTIRFDTMYEEAEYEIFAAFSTTVGSDSEFKYHEFINAYTEDEFYGYVDKVKELAYYDTNVNPVFGEYLLTLSTCSYGTSNERFVVVARRKI